MRAAWYASIGPARDVLQIGELDDPLPGPGEVRIRVLASAVNPSDLYARNGSRGAAAPGGRVVPHQDGAGRIDMVGDGVSPSRVGELVWCTLVRGDGDRGTAAERCVLAAERAVVAPPGADPLTLACIGIPWVTAWAAATLPRLDGSHGGTDEAPGGWCLVSGGAGAVGNFAIQASKALGRLVVATVSSPDSAPLAASAGADAVVVRGPDAAKAVLGATGGVGVERAIEVDLAGNIDLLLQVVGQGGLITAYGTGGRTAGIPVSAALRRQLQLRFLYTYDLPRHSVRAALEAAAGLLEAGRLVHLPVVAYPLTAIAEAHEAAEAGGGGRRIVCVPD